MVMISQIRARVTQAKLLIFKVREALLNPSHKHPSLYRTLSSSRLLITSAV